ncbi:hypothetical protein [Roseateles sp. L2-2]|uniref:hypothetical protein n=1 Tax=Roseateles sp. L2-2 TaxID=3422597 RepID=UPI003D36DBDA
MEAGILASDDLELRVLSGLQSGAALPLQDALAVGAGDDADLLLLGDGGTPARLLVRLAPDGGVTLEPLEAGVVLADGTALSAGTSTALQPGEAFRTGDAWLVVRPSSDAWDAWTPPRLDAAMAATTAPSPGDGVQTPIAADPIMVADVRTSRKVPSPRSPSAPRPMRALGSVIVAAGLLSTMLGVAALVRQAAEGEVAAGQDGAAGTKPDLRPRGGSRAASSTTTAAAPAASADVPPAVASAAKAVPGSVPAPSDAASTRAPAIEVIRGATSDRSGGHDRLLVNVPGDGIVILPFDIQEVLLGSHSQVTLTDGRRLEPGDRAGDWRLAEIRPGALVFDGPRKVQVGW